MFIHSIHFIVIHFSINEILSILFSFSVSLHGIRALACASFASCYKLFLFAKQRLLQEFSLNSDFARS